MRNYWTVLYLFLSTFSTRSYYLVPKPSEALVVKLFHADLSLINAKGLLGMNNNEWIIAYVKKKVTYLCIESMNT